MVEYIEDGDAAIFDDLIFRRDKRTGYYLNAKTHKRLHVYVWEKHHGKIPEGFHVHHRDFNKENNEIDNLVLMTAGEHLSLHGNSWDEERKQEHKKMLEIYARPKASEWHGSAEGIDWHKKHYEQFKDRLYVKKTFICDNCGKEFVSNDQGRNRFCSNACSSAFRRKSGVDNETRICKWCGKEFEVNKYAKTETCCRRCTMLRRWSEKRKTG